MTVKLSQAIDPIPTTSYDIASDVLYVRIPGEMIQSSHHIDDDSFTVLNLNNRGEVVGLQLIDFSDATETYWKAFQKEVPTALYEAVLNWIGRDDDVEPSLDSVR